MPAIYQADTWCDSCSEAIREQLLAETPEADRSRFDNERNYDSDEFPKVMGDDEESDCPQHCAGHGECLEAEVLPDGEKIGALLSTSLTAEGERYVKEVVAEGGAVAEFWRERFDWIDFPSEIE